MKLKFRSSLNKFNPFDSQSDAKPIDLSLKSRIKNFMKKSSCDEFKTSSNSLNSIKSSISSSSTNSINSISPTNSLNRQYDAPCRTPINVLGSLHSVPPSPPNSVEEDEEESAFVQQQQRRQIYYNHLLQKQYENQQLNLTLTNLLSASHLNKTNELFDNQIALENARAANFAAHHHASSRKPEEQLYANDRTEQLSKRVPSSLNQSAVSAVQQQHVHYQKQMVIKHASQMSKRNLQNHYDPYGLAAKRKHGKPNSDEDEEPADYYDSAKLISKLKMKYCSPSSQPVNSSPPRADQFDHHVRCSPVPHRMPSPLPANPTAFNVRNGCPKDGRLTGFNQNKPLFNTSPSLGQSDLGHLDPIFLQTVYKEYYGYLLSQSNGKLSALQIIMKNILEQKCGHSPQFGEENSPLFSNKANLLDRQFASSFTSMKTPSLSSTPSPNSQYHQTANFNLLHGEPNDSYLPSTPPSLKDDLTNETATPIHPEERKRSSRPLTGRHVRQGTGASPSTLANLKMAIKERQKRPIKRKGK